VQRFGPVASGVVFEPPAEFPIGGRAVEDSPQQRLQVQRRPADEQHLAPAPPDLLDAPVRRFEVLRQAEILVRLDNVNQVVRNRAPLVGRRLGRADVHCTVYRHRIERNDLRADPSGKLDAHSRLSGGGRAGEEPGLMIDD
jgi:hypothetical protein